MLPCICNMGFVGMFCQLKIQNLIGVCNTVNCGNGLCVIDVSLYIYSISLNIK